MLVTTKANVTYPVTIIKVNGVKSRAFLGTSSGSSQNKSGQERVKSNRNTNKFHHSKT